MGLCGKLVAQIEIKSGGDVFHELFRNTPHDIPNISPGCIQGCGLHQSDWGTVGSIYLWNYIHDGKACVAKELIESIDEEKKSITFKVLEGDLLKLYKNFSVTFHVDTNGDSNLVTWTFEYEKLSDNVPYPTTLMDFCIALTKDIETHHLKK
ncbi:kirola-like [Cornus florida]|uniref:kirola-like n=1 Tax=Cornus florida TaxID=4283 RepID=UPI00289E749D|nr:kirola-like [Cornus florida]